MESASSQCDGHFGPAVNHNCRRFDFTITFESAILSILPSCILLILALPRMWYLLHASSKFVQPWGKESWKTVLLAVLALLHLMLLCAASATMPQLQWILEPTYVVSLLSTIAAVLLSSLQHKAERAPSTLLGLYFSVVSLCDVVRTRTSWIANTPKVVAALQTTILCFDVLALVATSARGLKCSTQVSDEERCGLWERALMTWMLPLIRRGFRKTLTLDDLPQIDGQLRSEHLLGSFRATWTKHSKSGRYRLLFAAFKASLPAYLAPILPRLGLSASRLAQPFLLNAVVAYTSATTAPKSHGVGLMLAYGLVYIALALTTSLYWNLTYRFIARMRGSLISAIYEKTLRAKFSRDSNYSPVTLMGTDVEKIVLSFRQIHEIWASILEIAVAIWLLERQLGAASAVPGVLTIASTFGSVYLSSKAVSAQKKWLEAIEIRIGATSSMLSGLTPLRLAGMTTRVQKLIRGLRRSEVAQSRKYREVLVWTVLLGNGPELLSPVSTFTTFTIIAWVSGSNGLQTGQAFTSLSLLSLLTFPLNTLVQAGPQLSSALSCFARIQEFLLSEQQEPDRLESVVNNSSSEIDASSGDISNEKNTAVVHHSSNISDSASFDRFSEKALPDVLQLGKITPSRGSMTIVVGPVGCGKSTFLEDLLHHKRTINVTEGGCSGPVAYCSQEPWLLNDTVEYNILGGATMDRQRYAEALRLSGVGTFLSQLSDGDKTIVGSKGISLSGGQRQKIALARAVYSEAHLVLLDDIFAGLDASSEAQILDGLFSRSGYFRSKGTTVVIASHTTRILPLADHIVEMVSFDRFDYHAIEPTRKETPLQSAESSTDQPADSKALPSNRTKQVIEASAAKDTKATDLAEPQDARSKSRAGLYTYYAKASGIWACIALILSTLLCAFCEYFPSIWLQEYTKSNSGRSPGTFLAVYIVLTATGMILLLIHLWAQLITMTSNSGTALHEAVLDTTLHAYLPSLQKTDTGTILNRFTQDMELIDMGLPLAALNTTTAIAGCVMQLGLVIAVSHYLSTTIPLIAVAVYILQKVYLRTSRQLRILELEARAPLYTHFTETVHGITTIRAYQWEERFLAKSLGLIDQSQKPFYLLYNVQFWLNMVLNLMVAAMVVLLLGLVVALRNSTNPGFIGVALVTVMAFNQSLTSLLKYGTLLEISIGAVERVKTFSETITLERDSSRTTCELNKDWPAKGQVSIQGLRASYETKPVLHGVDLNVEAGQHTALCGASGSGKSSLMMAILRIINVDSGSVVIDGCDVADIPLDELRTRINVIPQDPYLGVGSLRHILAQDSDESDAAVERTLRLVGLWLETERRGGLDEPYKAESWSAGERQLLCMGRAILKRGSIILLDEATSSIDRETATKIQTLIREVFTDATVIAIIHQLEHVSGYDRVVVMDEGTIVEEGEPGMLLSEDSFFSRLYHS